MIGLWFTKFWKFSDKDVVEFGYLNLWTDKNIHPPPMWVGTIHRPKDSVEEKGKGKVNSFSSGVWTTFFSSSWTSELQVLWYLDSDLAPADLQFLRLWPQTESYTFRFPSSKAFGLGSNHTISFPGILVCREPNIKLSFYIILSISL